MSILDIWGVWSGLGLVTFDTLGSECTLRTDAGNGVAPRPNIKGCVLVAPDKFRTHVSDGVPA